MLKRSEAPSKSPDLVGEDVTWSKMIENSEKSQFVSVTITAFLLLATFTLSSVFVPRAEASSESIDSSVNLSKSGDVGLEITWSRPATSGMKVSNGTWSMNISSPASGKLKTNLDISITFSEKGSQWLSEEEVGGFSLDTLLSLVDGNPGTLNDFLLDDWEGKVVSNVEWLTMALDLLPSSLSEKIGGLTIESANCTRFSWNKPDNMGIGVDITFSGVNNSSCVGQSNLGLSGSMNVSGSTVTKTVSSSCEASGNSDGWTWNFGIPHIACLYGSGDYTDMRNGFSQKQADFRINSVEDTDFSNAPEGYSKSGLVYEWTGADAANALAALISGEGGYSISYHEGSLGSGQDNDSVPENDDNIVDDNLENVQIPDFSDFILGLNPENAVRELENLDHENFGHLLDDYVRENLTENICKILLRMGPENVASVRHFSSGESAVQITEAIAENDMESAARMVEQGVKENLVREATIISRLKISLSTELITRIFDLPNTPQVAADLLEALNRDTRIGVISNLLDQEKFDYINGLFSLLSDGTVNDIYEGIETEERGVLYPEMDDNVKDKISEDLKPRFTLGNLTLSDEELSPGEELEISVDVLNSGGTPASYPVDLILDGIVVEDDEVYLGSKEMETVTFTRAFEEPGTHDFRISDLEEEVQVNVSEVNQKEGDSGDGGSNLVFYVAGGVIVAILIIGFYFLRKSR